MPTFRILAWCCCFGLFSATTPAFAEGLPYECGQLQNPDQYGPFDFRTATAQQKQLVLGAHFTPEIESLTSGRSGKIGGEIDYTLRAFPNYPRALMAMTRLAEREKRSTPAGARYSVDCYFQRALAFAPDDPSVRLVYGIYLVRDHKPSEAVRELIEAQKLKPDDPNIEYNLGLAYFDLKDYDKSLEHAKKAYALGYPLPWLRDKLKAGGHWKE